MALHLRVCCLLLQHYSFLLIFCYLPKDTSASLVLFFLSSIFGDMTYLSSVPRYLTTPDLTVRFRHRPPIYCHLHNPISKCLCMHVYRSTATWGERTSAQGVKKRAWTGGAEVPAKWCVSRRNKLLGWRPGNGLDGLGLA